MENDSVASNRTCLSNNRLKLGLVSLPFIPLPTLLTQKVQDCLWTHSEKHCQSLTALRKPVLTTALYWEWPQRPALCRWLTKSSSFFFVWRQQIEFEKLQQCNRTTCSAHQVPFLYQNTLHRGAAHEGRDTAPVTSVFGNATSHTVYSTNYVNRFSAQQAQKSLTFSLHSHLQCK